MLLSSAYVQSIRDVYRLLTSRILKTVLKLNECYDRFLNN